MASVRKYSTAKGHAWRVQYRSPDGKSRTKQGFRTKAEAQAWADKNAVAVREHDWVDPTAGKVTVDEVGEKWLAMQTHLKPSTARTTEISWRKQVKPKWGARAIASIKPSEVQHWVSTMDASASTVRKAHAVLAQALDMAVKDSMLRANPARQVKLPRKAPARKVYLTTKQLHTLASECRQYGELVLLLGTVGLRWGEAAGLQVGDVDFLRRRIHVERNAVTVANRIVVGTPKTYEKRSVSVPKTVLDMLEPLTRGKGKGDWLWSKDGEPLRAPSHHSFFHCALRRVRERDPEFPWLTPHGLRHVAAGLMISAGANAKVVQRQLGHASAAMTLDVYAALWDDDLDAVGVAVDESLSRVVGLSWKSS